MKFTRIFGAAFVLAVVFLVSAPSAWAQGSDNSENDIFITSIPSLANADENASYGDVMLPPNELKGEENTVALWHFNEGAGTVIEDETPNVNNGSTTLGPVRVESRVGLGYALIYDNDDWIHAPDSPSLNPSELTVEAWVYPRSFAAGNENDWAKIIVAKGVDTVDGYYALIVDGGHPQAQLRIGETLYIAQSYNKLQLNHWQFLAMTYDGDNLKLYVNGEFVASRRGIGQPRTNNIDPLTIGKQYLAAPHSYYWDGLIDEIRIENRVLNADEVKQDFENVELTVDDYTAALWHFNEGTDAVAYDSSPNGNHGRLSGTVWSDGRFAGRKALDFGGVTSSVEVSDSSSLSPSGGMQELSVELWYYPRSSQAAIIAGKFNFDNGQGWFLKSEPASDPNKFKFVGWVGGGLDDNSIGIAVDDAAPLNQWAHLALTYDGENLRVYVNGEERAVSYYWYPHGAFGGGPVESTTDDLYIGADHGAWDRVDGKIDEVRLENRALTPQEIASDAKLYSSTIGLVITEANYYDAGFGSPGWDLISWGETLAENTDIELYVATSDNAEVDSATVALWHFDENILSKVFDSTPNHNDGTINGASWVGGRYGSALVFDNQDNVVIIDSDSLDMTTGLTLEAWIYPYSFPAGNPDWLDTIIAKGNDGTNGYYGLGIDVDREVEFKIKDSTGATTTLKSTSTMTENTWYRIAATYDGQNMRVYFNGTEEASTPLTNSIGANDDDLYLGMHPAAGYEYRFDGMIDEVRISNVARTGEEILARYENSATYAWDDWTGPYTDNSGENITSTSKRYVKWKAILSSTDREHSPILHHVTVSYPEVGGPRVNVNFTFPRFKTVLGNLNPSMVVASPQERTKLGVVLSANEDLRRLDNRLENRKIAWTVFGQTYENHTYRNSENLDLPPESENMENEELLGMAWIEVQAPQEVGVSTAAVSFEGDMEHEPSENAFSVHVTVIKLVETTESVIDRKVDSLWSEPSVQDLLAESGLSLPKENTRIGVTMEPIGAWENVTTENVHIWAVDADNVQHQLQVTENENLGENLRFWATYDPDENLPDNALGYFDVRVTVDGVGQSDNRLSGHLFQVGDLDLVGSHDNLVQAGENQLLRGMAWGIGRFEELEVAYVLDNLKENAFQIGWVENVFYEENYEITPDDIFLRLPPGGEGEVAVLLLSENLEGSWENSYHAVPFVLDNEKVDPDSGVLENENFIPTFTVTATRPENVTLENVVVYIDGKPHEMSAGPSDNGQWEGTVEENYSFTWHPYEEGNKENIGDHSYYFVATDGVDNFRLPSSEAFSGPRLTSNAFWSQYAGFFLENVDIYDNYYFNSSDILPEVHSVLFEMIVPENSEKNENKWGENMGDNVWWAEFNMGDFGVNPQLKVTYYNVENELIENFSVNPLVIQTPDWLADMIEGVDVVYNDVDNYWEITVGAYELLEMSTQADVLGLDIWEGIGDGGYGVTLSGTKVKFTLCSTQYDEWVEVGSVGVGVQGIEFGDWDFTPAVELLGGFWVLPNGREEISNIWLSIRFSGEMSMEIPIAAFTIGPVPVTIKAKPSIFADLEIILGPDSPITVKDVRGSVGGGLGIYGGVDVIIAEGGVYGKVIGRAHFRPSLPPLNLEVYMVSIRGEFGVYIRFIFWTWERAIWEGDAYWPP